MFYLIGLGNPGDEYKNTRHNIGREIVEFFCKKNDFSDFSYDKKSDSLIAKGKIGQESVTAILPETFMNKSGKAVAYFVKTKKLGKNAGNYKGLIGAENILVVHDDLDLSVSHYKIQFNRGSGGNKGVESIHKTLKTEAYARIKIGTSPSTPKGKIKKPEQGEKVINHVLGKFSPKDIEQFKKIRPKILKAIEATITEGYTFAMNHFN
jgi:peptidyl-tRNA hydrolase, PTH1 family